MMGILFLLTSLHLLIDPYNSFVFLLTLSILDWETFSMLICSV